MMKLYYAGTHVPGSWSFGTGDFSGLVHRKLGPQVPPRFHSPPHNPPAP